MWLGNHQGVIRGSEMIFIRIWEGGQEEGSRARRRATNTYKCLSNDTEIIMPILQMRKLRLKKLNNLPKVKQLISGKTVT